MMRKPNRASYSTKRSAAIRAMISSLAAVEAQGATLWSHDLRSRFNFVFINSSRWTRLSRFDS